MSIYTSVVIGLEYLYESAMEYLNQTYHQYTTDLPDIPLSEAELGDQAYYASMAADTAANYYRIQAQQAAQRGYGQPGTRHVYSSYAPPPEPREYNRPSYMPPDYSSASLYDFYNSENIDPSIPIGRLVI